MRKRQAPKHAAPKADVPAELQSQDYGFPRVHLPASRPHPSPQQLHDALADDDTQPMAPVQPQMRIVDRTPQPARHEGLSPAAVPVIPVPSLPFLNGGMQQRPLAAAQGTALPAALTQLELELLGRAVDEIPGARDEPTQPLPAVRRRPPLGAPTAHRPRAEVTDHGVLILASFYDDPDFSGRLSHHIRQVSGKAVELLRANEIRETDLRVRLAALDEAHRAAVAAEAPGQYAQQLAAAALPLPHRTPGAFRSEIEASRGTAAAL